jgi:hypothetical protein
MSKYSKNRFRPALEVAEARALLSSALAGLPPVPTTARGAPSAAIRADLGASLPTAVDGFDRARFPGERRGLSARDYPNLGRDYEVLAPGTSRYNCVAHTLGVHDRWISIATGPAKDPFAWLDRVLGTRGYRRLPEPDAGLTPGVQKVAAYGYAGRAGSVREVKHVALQAADGTWTSKLGHLALIRHPHLESLNGPLYGRPIAIYARAA